MQKKKGFTLMEIVLVIAILALFSMLAIPNFASLISGTSEHLAKKNLQIIQSAFQLEKSIALSNGKILPENYEISISKTGESSPVGFYDKLEEMLPEEFKGNYEIWERRTAGTTEYKISYFIKGKTYVLENGEISVE